MKVDLHTHSSNYSGCSTVSALERVQLARVSGLDGVVITDHHHHLTGEEQQRLESAVPGIKVFRGCEITIRFEEPAGERSEDMLIIAEESFHCPNVLESRDVPLIKDFSEQCDALTILAHPFRYDDAVQLDLRLFQPDALEIASCNIRHGTRNMIEEYAEQNNFLKVAASDSHHNEPMNRYYIELEHTVKNERELARAVKAGSYRMIISE